MYQFRSTGALCSSKKIFETKAQMFSHLQEVIAKTEKFRKNLKDLDLENLRWNRKITSKEIAESICITSFDPNICVDSIAMFSTDKDITDQNLKSYVKMELERINKIQEREKGNFVIRII